MFDVQHLHQPISRFCALLLRIQHAPRLPIRYPQHHRLQLPSENQAVVSLKPVPLILLPTGDVEVLRASAQHLLHKHPISPGFPGVGPLLNPPPYYVGCGDMSGLLQYYCLEDS